jgi:hypothetical protein
MKKIKTYNVSWNEKHAVVIDAKNEKEAKEKVLNGCFGSDDSVETSEIEVEELVKIKSRSDVLVKKESVCRAQIIDTLLQPQIEALEREYFEKADEELEEEYELNFGEEIKIV